MAKKKSGKTTITANGSPKKFTASDRNEATTLLANEMTRTIRVCNETLLRKRQTLMKGLDPRRDLDDECGYPKTGELTAQEFKNLYDRESIATRVVEVMPAETWKISPSVFETEDVNQVTSFEAAWKEVCNSLPTTVDEEESGWFQDENCNPMWELLSRADAMSGIGHYGTILLGLPGSLDQPTKFSPGKSVSTELLYARVYDETLCPVESYNNDNSSRRYGQPEFYNFTLADINEDHAGLNLDTKMVKVHWSRVVHLADNLNSSEVIGVPRMRPVYNRLYDLMKLYGGSAEMYWKGAFFGISLETHPELGGDIDLPSDIKDQMENYMNGLQRYLAIAGTTVNSIAPQVVGPAEHVDTYLDAICIVLGIPKRIFMGTERGKLASTQDEGTWKDRLMARRVNYVTPRIIVPFINRLILTGVLPIPTKGYKVDWSEQDTMKPAERSNVASQRAEALTKYIQGKVYKLIKPMDYLTRELGYDREDAQSIIDNAGGEEAIVTSIEEQENKEMEIQERQFEMRQRDRTPNSSTDPTDGRRDQQRDGTLTGVNESG